MIKRILDTNICIYIAKNHPAEVAKEFAKYYYGEVVISAITWAELCCGIRNDDFSLLEVLDVVSFDQIAARQYSELTKKHPNRKGGFDRLIAAHAITLNVPLVTNNIKDFELYKADGLNLENWISYVQ